MPAPNRWQRRSAWRWLYADEMPLGQAWRYFLPGAATVPMKEHGLGAFSEPRDLAVGS